MKIKTIFIKNIISAAIILLALNGCSKKSKQKNSDVDNLLSTNLDKGSYNIKASESEVKWIGKELSTSTHTGTLVLKKGKIDINANGVIYGNVEIDMNTINVTDMGGGGKIKLEGHLRSSDFFDVDKYPSAFITFNSGNNPVFNNQIKLNGTLTIKDITHPISFTAEILQKQPHLMAKASMSFDRSKYDVRFRSGKFFENLGDKLILDDIDIDVLLVTN